MIFWVPLSLQKKVYGPSQHSSMFHFLQCFPTILSLKFFQNIKHFQSLNAHNIPMYFFVSFNILSKPSTLNAWCSLFPPKKIMSNLVPLMFSMCLFNTLVIIACCFDIPCHHSYLLVLLHLSSSLLLFGHFFC